MAESSIDQILVQKDLAEYGSRTSDCTHEVVLAEKLDDLGQEGGQCIKFMYTIWVAETIDTYKFLIVIILHHNIYHPVVCRSNPVMFIRPFEFSTNLIKTIFFIQLSPC